MTSHSQQDSECEEVISISAKSLIPFLNLCYFYYILIYYIFL